MMNVIESIMTNYPILWIPVIITIIAIIIVIINSTFKLLDNIISKLIPTPFVVTLRSGEKTEMILFKEYKNGKIFISNNDTIIITDINNNQIPCLEIDMLIE